jgi:uncharacterized protein YecT (DUF1311 family)
VLAATLAAAQNDKSANAPSGQPSDAVCVANTQIEIDQCLSNAYQSADKELNQVYSQLMKKQDAAGQSRLQVAQRAWIKYRDAHCTAAAAIYQGGSIQPSVRSGCLTRITRARIDELHQVYAMGP